MMVVKPHADYWLLVLQCCSPRLAWWKNLRVVSRDLHEFLNTPLILTLLLSNSFRSDILNGWWRFQSWLWADESLGVHSIQLESLNEKASQFHRHWLDSDDLVHVRFVGPASDWPFHLWFAVICKRGFQFPCQIISLFQLWRVFHSEPLSGQEKFVVSWYRSCDLQLQIFQKSPIHRSVILNISHRHDSWEIEDPAREFSLFLEPHEKDFVPLISCDFRVTAPVVSLIGQLPFSAPEFGWLALHAEDLNTKLPLGFAVLEYLSLYSLSSTLVFGLTFRTYPSLFLVVHPQGLDLIRVPHFSSTPSSLLKLEQNPAFSSQRKICPLLVDLHTLLILSFSVSRSDTDFIVIKFTSSFFLDSSS